MSKSIIRPGDPEPTEAQEKAICLWLSKGAIVDTALARAGVPRSLYLRWLRAGSEGLEPYATFTARIESALVLFECRLLEEIDKHSNKNLAALTFLFNLKFAAKYKRAADIEAGLAVDAPMAAATTKEVSEEELEAAEHRALEASKHVEQTRPKVLNFGLEDPGKKVH